MKASVRFLYKPMSRAVHEQTLWSQASEGLCEKAGCAVLWMDARSLSSKTEHSPPHCTYLSLLYPAHPLSARKRERETGMRNPI